MRPNPPGGKIFLQRQSYAAEFVFHSTLADDPQVLGYALVHPHPHHPHPHMIQTPSPPRENGDHFPTTTRLPYLALSPAEAIAEAWKREAIESQEKWRRIDANVKRRYAAPRPPPSARRTGSHGTKM